MGMGDYMGRLVGSSLATAGSPYNTFSGSPTDGPMFNPGSMVWYYSPTPDQAPAAAAPAAAAPAPAAAAPAAEAAAAPAPAAATGPIGSPIDPGGPIDQPAPDTTNRSSTGSLLGGSILDPPKYFIGDVANYTKANPTGRSRGAMTTSQT